MVAVDSSQPALEEAQINAARNKLEGITEFVKDDALKYMKVSAVKVLVFFLLLSVLPTLAYCHSTISQLKVCLAVFPGGCRDSLQCVAVSSVGCAALLVFMTENHVNQKPR